MYDNAAIEGYLAGMSTGMILLLLGLCLFGLISTWRVFEKAGQGGWKCLIPIYNVYIYYKVAWEGKYFVLPLLAAFVAILIGAVGISANSSTLSAIGGFLDIAVYAVIGVFSIVADVKLARRFGKGAGFAIGLLFLPVVFLPILAFGSSYYDRRLA